MVALQTYEGTVEPNRVDPDLVVERYLKDLAAKCRSGAGWRRFGCGVSGL